MKKLIICLMVTLLAIFPLFALAQYAETNSVNLHLRQEPNIESHIINSYRNATYVEVTGEEVNGYYPVRVDPYGTMGYMAGEYLILDDGTMGNWGVVVGGSLHLRSHPSLESTVLATYRSNTPVEILAQDGEFYYVRIQGETLGYMDMEYIQLVNGCPARNVCVMVGEDHRANFRSEPSLSAGILGSYVDGTYAQLLVNGRNWCKLIINGQVGYMVSDYVSLHQVADHVKPDGDHKIGTGVHWDPTGDHEIGTGVHEDPAPDHEIGSGVTGDDTPDHEIGSGVTDDNNNGGIGSGVH